MSGRGRVWSGGGFEGDFEAEGFELADVVAFLAFRTGAVVAREDRRMGSLSELCTPGISRNSDQASRAGGG